MRLYRICHVRYLENLRGLGASYRDGARWNERGGAPARRRRETLSPSRGEHASPLEGTATAARWLEASMGAGDADAYWPALLRRLETCCVAEEESP